MLPAPNGAALIAVVLGTLLRENKIALKTVFFFHRRALFFS